MSWFALDRHEDFVSAWSLISDIATLESTSLQCAARLLMRLNERDPIDGSYAIPFYGYNEFEGYFIASPDEVVLCIDALRLAITMGVALVRDDSFEEIHISLSEALSAGTGLDFLFNKGDVIRAITHISISLNVPLKFPKCLQSNKVEISLANKNDNLPKQSTKTSRAQARFIKTLLFFTYSDEKIVNNPRSYFDNPDSEICRDFRAMGLKLPTGKTVQKWLEDVDIDWLVKKE